MRLLEDAVQRARSKIIAEVPGNCYTPRFCKMLILTMAATAMRHLVPPIRFYKLDNISYFNASAQSPVSIIRTPSSVGNSALGPPHRIGRISTLTLSKRREPEASASMKPKSYDPMKPGPGIQEKRPERRSRVEPIGSGRSSSPTMR